MKQAVLGPFSAGTSLTGASALNADLRALADAGCPFIEIHEPAFAGIGGDSEAWGVVGDIHALATEGVGGTHLSLAITGGAVDTAGFDTLLAVQYSSYARWTSSPAPTIGGSSEPSQATGVSSAAPWVRRWMRTRARRRCCGPQAYAASSAGRGRDPVSGWPPSVVAGRPLVGRRGPPKLISVLALPSRLEPVKLGRRASKTMAHALDRQLERQSIGPWSDARSSWPRRRRSAPEAADLNFRVSVGATIHLPLRPRLLFARHPPQEVPPVTEHISLVVNGTPRELDVEPRRLLVQALREDLDLTGTHVGCDTSQCGACTVHVDGKAVKSCTMLAVQADGAERHAPSRAWPTATRSTRSRRRSGRSTACSAASARRA